MSAGKGDKQRPRDEKKWQNAPFWKRKDRVQIKSVDDILAVGNLIAGISQDQKQENEK